MRFLFVWALAALCAEFTIAQVMGRSPRLLSLEECFQLALRHNLDLQIELFDVALDDLETDRDLVNQVLEITLEEDDGVHIQRYRLPKADPERWRSPNAGSAPALVS